MISRTRCHKKHDGTGCFVEQTVMVSVTSLSYQMVTAGGEHAANAV